MKKYFLAIAICIAISAASFSQIVFNECVNVQQAPSFWYNPMKMSDTKILAFDEAELKNVSGEFSYQRINKWDDFDNFISIPFENVNLSGHMIYFQKMNSKGRVKIIAEIEFKNPIVGFVADGFLFDKDKQALFAPNPTHTKPAEKVNTWSLEEESSWSPLDKVIILSPTRIRLEITNESATDALRVITISKSL